MRDLIRLHMWPKETSLKRMLTFSRTGIALLLIAVSVGAICPIFSQTVVRTPAKTGSGACGSLNSLQFPEVNSLVAERVTQGEFQPPRGKKLTDFPVFCRVHLVASTSPQSIVNVELWLPETGWNGRLLGTGTGGGAGAISFVQLPAGLRRGFAVANTDLGTSPNANAATDFPGKWADFGYRATHEMTVLAKQVVRAYYGQAPQKSYFVGCSTGGQQALSEAQRFPMDYNGIIAGAPANNRTHLHSEFLWQYQATHKTPQAFLSPALIALVTRAAVSACHGKDGGAPSDNFLTDPRVCKFDPDSLPHCAKDQVTDCITPQTLAALKAIYKGPRNPGTGEQIYAPLPFGTEASGGGLTFQENGFTQQLMYPFLWAFGPGFDPMKFDFNKDEDELDDTLGGILNANNPDLTEFQNAGGKLIMFTGTADPLVPFPDALNYYERVIAFEGQHSSPAAKEPLQLTQEFFRYYLVPGMGHCGGGPGLNSIGQRISDHEDDLLDKLELWTEKGRAPGEIVAIRLNGASGETQTIMERNVCPYPELPTYVGGDPAKESSFTCKPHARGNVITPAPGYLQ